MKLTYILVAASLLLCAFNANGSPFVTNPDPKTRKAYLVSPIGMADNGTCDGGLGFYREEYESLCEKTYLCIFGNRYRIFCSLGFVFDMSTGKCIVAPADRAECWNED